MFLPLTVWTPHNQPTVIEMVGDWLNSLSPASSSENTGSIPNLVKNASGKLKFNLIKTIAPLLRYCAVFSLIDPVNSPVDQTVNQHFNIHGLKGKITQIKMFDSILELYITIDEIPENQDSNALSVDPALFIELLFVGSTNITEWRTFKRVQINIMPVMIIVMVLVSIGVLIYGRN